MLIQTLLLFFVTQTRFSEAFERDDHPSPLQQKETYLPAPKFMIPPWSFQNYYLPSMSRFSHPVEISSQQSTVDPVILFLLPLRQLLGPGYGIGTRAPKPIISVYNGQIWGSWGQMDFCPANTKAIGFAQKVESNQGNRDDTALNGIKLYCADVSSGSPDSADVTTTQDQGLWGIWSGRITCLGNGYLVSFRLKVEGNQGGGDDTAANDIQFRCSTGEILSSDNGGAWGTWGEWSDACSNGIFGIQSKIESNQGDGDDTALNDVAFWCS